MAFKKFETEFDGLWQIQPDVFGDQRGFFIETWNSLDFAQIGLDLNFTQDNLSFSSKGTLRGLHFQAPPAQQGKLVFVIQGAVLDIAVDIRKSSKTYGKVFKAELSSENHTMLYVPPGFAHGFLVLSETSLFCYKCTAPYNKASEGGLMWNDKAFGINWGISEPLLSAKDQIYLPFEKFNSPFE